MPQRIIVTADGGIRVIEVGPIGPPGPPGTGGGGGISPEGVAMLSGGNTFDGLQALVANLPLITLAEVMAGAEFTTLTSITTGSGHPLYEIVAARIDTTPFGEGLTEITQIAVLWHEISPATGEPTGRMVVEFISADSPTLPLMKRKALFTSRQISNMFAFTEENFVYEVVPQPLEDLHPANKKYVDDTVAAISGIDPGSLLPPTKYGIRNGGKWALCGAPGAWSTPDVGPLNREGIRWRGRVCPFENDPPRWGSLIQFWELLTQFRNADGNTFDQNNEEIALYNHDSLIGAFEESCLITTPFPVMSGEHQPGRIYSNDVLPGQRSYPLGITLGDAIELRFDYIYDNGEGRWVKRFFYRTDRRSYSAANGDVVERRPESETVPDYPWWWPTKNTDPGADLGRQDIYWKLFVERIAEDEEVGSIADAGQPWWVGRNGGIMGIERSMLWHIDSTIPDVGEELVLDFQSKNIDPVTGIAESQLIPGQIWTPQIGDGVPGIPPVIDNSAFGLSETERRIRLLEGA